MTAEAALELPVMPAPAEALFLTAVGLKARRVPAWITDPNLQADILAGLIDIPDDLMGEQ
ncbi:hypothetical protein ACFTXJ_14710 [Streptomyces zhihengii]|uniref:hypothetical protein n=1 Tax=Streptomyces zhihengii TaxID=1818004 RepID=UPI0036411E63